MSQSRATYHVAASLAVVTALEAVVLLLVTITLQARGQGALDSGGHDDCRRLSSRAGGGGRCRAEREREAEKLKICSREKGGERLQWEGNGRRAGGQWMMEEDGDDGPIIPLWWYVRSTCINRLSEYAAG